MPGLWWDVCCRKWTNTEDSPPLCSLHSVTEQPQKPWKATGNLHGIWMLHITALSKKMPECRVNLRIVIAYTCGFSAYRETPSFPEGCKLLATWERQAAAGAHQASFQKPGVRGLPHSPLGLAPGKHGNNSSEMFSCVKYSVLTAPMSCRRGMGSAGQVDDC